MRSRGILRKKTSKHSHPQTARQASAIEKFLDLVFRASEELK